MPASKTHSAKPPKDGVPTRPLYERLGRLEVPLTLQQRAERESLRRADSATLNADKIHAGLDVTEATLANSTHDESSLMRLHETRHIDALGAPEYVQPLYDRVDSLTLSKEYRQCRQAMFELGAMHPTGAGMLADDDNGMSERAIADGWHTSRGSVIRILRKARAWRDARIAELQRVEGVPLTPPESVPPPQE